MFAQESVMDIQKEREAFLNVYVNYKGDSRKIQFNEETEQFMWRKNNVSDTEVEYVHLMNQRWYAWLACAKSKAQAVPEVINVGNELQSWVAVWSFKARHDREDYIVVDANLLADKIEKLTGANA